MAPDNELLARWLKTGSEKDFGELVQRHLRMVHSAALRVVNGDQHLAEDITQTVFADLARKARTLRDRPSLAGWLHTSARYAALTHLRGEHRRRQREQEAHAMPTDPSTDAFDWSELRPVIDDAVGDLSAKDREALLLRFFENRSHREIGEILGLNDNAARMRVERALDKVRRLLAKRGVTSSASGLAAALLAHTTLGTASLTAAQITATAVTASAAVGSGFTLLHLMTATQLKTGLAAVAVVAGLSVPLVVQNRANAELRTQNAKLAGQLVRIPALESENERLRGETVDRAELEALRLEHRELVQRREEVALLNKALAASRLAHNSSKPNTNEEVSLTDDATVERRKTAIGLELQSMREPIANQVTLWIQLHPIIAGGNTVSNSVELAQEMLIETEAMVGKLANRYHDLSLELARLNNQNSPVQEGSFIEEMPLVDWSSSSEPSKELIYRERTPAIAREAGQFRRLYWFADGHSEEVVQSHRDFSAWERSHGAR